MTQQQDQYDLNVIWAAIAALEKTLDDGLAMLRLIGPDLDPEYNDQIGLARLTTTERGAIGGNRSGKSSAAAAIIAAAARDIPLITWDGKEIDCRMPHQKDRALTIWVIGLQLNHIGQTIFRLLFQPGAFRTIPDEHTGVHRAWAPWRKYDAENESLTKPGPPLIPPAAIDHDSWEWESKAGKQVAGVKLLNGTQFYFYASTSDVKMGDPVDIIWPDEAIKYSSHYAEWIMRLTDFRGWILWSTMRRAGVPALEGLLERDELQAEELSRGERDKVTAKCFFFKQSGNPFLPKERVAENREFLESLSEEEVMMRADGGMRFDNTLIYPFFNKRTCAAIPPLNVDGTPNNPAEWDNLAHVLHKLNGLPPADWTHELIVDPGAQKPCVLFCAVPPQHWTDAEGKEWNLWAGPSRPYFVPYDEIYGKRYSLQQLVDQIKVKVRGITFRRFVIDMQAAQQTPTVGGATVLQQYSEAFGRAELMSHEGGTGFVRGDKNFQARSRIVDSWMQITSSGKPQLRIVTQRCPNLVWQLARNQRAMDGDVVLDKEARRERNDARVCFDKATEVLTDSGWMFFKDLSGDEQLATLNMQQNTLEFQRPSRLVANYHSGKMVRFDGMKLDAMVTPDHRMVSFEQGEHEFSELRQACDLRTQDSLRVRCGQWLGTDHERILIPRPRKARELEKELDPGDLAEFLGWYVAEGCKSTPRCPGWGWRVMISQTKPAGCELLESLFLLLPWKFRRDGDNYSFSSKQLWCYLDSLEVGDRCWNKRVPNWIKQAHPRIIRRFLTGYVLGDGWVDHGAERSVTTSEQLANDIQELYLKIGSSASIRVRRSGEWNIRGRSGVTRRSFVVTQLKLQRAGLYSHDSKRNFRDVDYDDFVYCATVPNGTLVTRRNGAPLVAGNCLEYYASRNPGYVLIEQTRQPQWVNRMRTSINEIFGGRKDEEARCHFGPGLAPRGSSV